MNKQLDIEWANQQSILYSFGHFLGRGRNGSVFFGKNKENNENFALKVVDRSMCENELNILKNLPKHVNIVQMKDHFFLDHFCIFVLELCDYTLKKEIEENNGISEENVLIFFKNIKEGLFALINSNIFHRDIKAENILISCDKDGNKILKLGDFGNATFMNSLDQKFRIFAGTSYYISPEMWEYGGCEYNSKSDLYSCGVLIYEMLNGSPPFGNIKKILQIKKLCMKGITESEIDHLSFSKEGKEMLKGLLSKIEKRISWDEFFDSKWFKQKK